MQADKLIQSLHRDAAAPADAGGTTASPVVVMFGSFAAELQAARAEIAGLWADNVALAKALNDLFQIALVP